MCFDYINETYYQVNFLVLDLCETKIGSLFKHCNVAGHGFMVSPPLYFGGSATRSSFLGLEGQLACDHCRSNL